MSWAQWVGSSNPWRTPAADLKSAERKLENRISREPRNSPLKIKHQYALSFRKSHGTWFESSLGHGEVHVPRLDATATRILRLQRTAGITRPGPGRIGGSGWSSLHH
jgi:hypothetical protein